MNKRHAAVSTIIISGMPNDHFSEPYQHILNYADYIPQEVGDEINVSEEYTILRKEPADNRSTPGIEHICLEINQKNKSVVAKKQLEIFRFVKNPDLMRAQITEEDMPLLLDIALRDPRQIAFHCGAGLSRSISKLLMFIIFNKLNNNMIQFVKGECIDMEGFLKGVAEEYRRIRIHRPGAMGNNDLLIEAITLAIQMRKEFLLTQRNSLKVKIHSEAKVMPNESHIYTHDSGAHKYSYI